MAVSERLRARGVMLAGLGFLLVSGPMANTQTATPAGQAATKKPKTASHAAMAVWTPDVLQAFAIYPSEFNNSGLNKLTKTQLATLIAAAHPAAGRHVLACPTSGATPAGKIRVLLTVAGDDSSGQIANQIHGVVSQLPNVDIVTDPASADRALHVVIQEQTMNKHTIGYTAAYVTATPCADSFQGKTTAVELKGELGTYTDPKGPELAAELAKMLGRDLQSLPKSQAAAIPAGTQ